MSTGGSQGIGPPGPPDETGWRTKLLLLRLQRRSRLARSDDLPNRRVVKAPRGTELSAKSWLTEAPLRMLMNNLDPEVAERPEDLVVYRSEEHTSELQSLMRISYAVFCLKKKTKKHMK